MFRLKREYTEYENKSLRLPKDLIEKVQSLANENQMSFNKVVIQCIEYALENVEGNTDNQEK
ncbi:Arc family DNA-binding protein [Lachnospiraceae bacterium 45-W7]